MSGLTPPTRSSSVKFLPRLRFSLRTFLALVTIFCIALTWQLHRAKLQRNAAAAIRAAGGWVYYDYQGHDLTTGKLVAAARPGEPQWLLNLVGVDFFHDVTVVNMVYDDQGPKRLDNKQSPVNIAPHLAHFPRLRSLLVSGDYLDDEGMRVFGRLRQLETFYQWEGKAIGDAGAEHLRGLPRLRYVHLGDSLVGDRGLAALATVPNLDGLSMQRNKITDAGLASLAGHPKLKSLWIGGLEGLTPITDAGVAHLANLPQLEELDLQHTRVTPEGLKALQKLPKLKSLLLSGSTADNYALVAPLFPNCVVDANKNPPPPGTPKL